MNAATTSTNEPQTAAFQAAVDNIYFEIIRKSRLFQSQWNFDNAKARADRWDYVSNLEEQIIQALRPHRAADNTRN